MAFTGTLKSWDDERGFGFITPAAGGRDLFVHISAFPRDGLRPTVGETLTCELGRGKDGNPAVVRVQRHAVGDPSHNPQHNRALLATVVIVLFVVVLGALAYSNYEQPSQQAVSAPVSPAPTSAISDELADLKQQYNKKTASRPATPPPASATPDELAHSQYEQYGKPAASAPVTPPPASATPNETVQVQSRCDGRIYCSQMTSCDEAMYFLKHCPGTKMDGDYDGVPCEQQWCNSPFEK